MKIIITTKNLELTESIKNFIEEKIGSLKKFITVLNEGAQKKGLPASRQGKTLAEAFVEIKKETKHHRKGDVFKAKTEILLPGKKVVAESTGDDLLLAIVEVKDELQQEIKKYKTKAIDFERGKQRKAKKEIIL